MEFKVGDKVEVLLHSRLKGHGNTGGGWSSNWLPATILKIKPKTVDVWTEEYYYGHYHTVKHDRIMLPQERS